MCKRARVPLLDIDEVLPMNPPFHPLLIRQAFISGSKRRKTNRAGSSQAAVEADDEGGVDARPTVLSPPSPSPHYQVHGWRRTWRPSREDWDTPMLAPLQFHAALLLRSRCSTASCVRRGGRVW
ncbi:hypothetical protein KY289_035653 [Solanum tuberosum]|nr:hypothetical protein KY289_035653 [Solanum tuberosum]